MLHVTIPATVARVNFYTGVSEPTLMDLFSRAQCSLSITADHSSSSSKAATAGPAGFLWKISFGEDVMAVKQIVRLNQEFDYTLPITGENVKVY